MIFKTLKKKYIMNLEKNNDYSFCSLLLNSSLVLFKSKMINFWPVYFILFLLAELKIIIFKFLIKKLKNFDILLL